MPEKQQGKWVGKGMKRKEDLRLLTGRGCFMDDIRLPNMKYAAILRSPYPHAWIKGDGYIPSPEGFRSQRCSDR